MEDLVFVTYPDPVEIEARPIEHDAVPDGSVGLGYYYRNRLIARGIVTPDAVDAIGTLLQGPVSVALAASEDDKGNIDARFCLVLPVDAEQAIESEDEPHEPWRDSITSGTEAWRGEGPPETGDDAQPQLALLPIGHVVRSARDRQHDSVADDAREMLANLIEGKAQDAVSKAIDDLLNNL